VLEQVVDDSLNHLAVQPSHIEAHHREILQFLRFGRSLSAPLFVLVSDIASSPCCCWLPFFVIVVAFLHSSSRSPLQSFLHSAICHSEEATHLYSSSSLGTPIVVVGSPGPVTLLCNCSFCFGSPSLQSLSSPPFSAASPS
jgi:hypothetical protein